jgi:hypothetical protein
MSNGHVCCLLQVCCPPPGNRDARIKALAAEMEEGIGENLTCYQAAEWMVDNIGMVPLGLDTAIVSAYAPEFAKQKT